MLLHMLRRGRDYDVVHACSFPYFSLLAAALVRPLRGYALEVDWFEVWSRHYWLDYLGGAGGRIGAFVQRLCARVPQRAFCFSELHAERLREEGLRGPVTVLRGLYAGGPESSGEPADEPYDDSLVLFVGRLIAEKQATLGVAAIALARERDGQLRGEFLGDGPERAALEQAIAEHGLQQQRLGAGLRRVARRSIARCAGRCACCCPRAARATAWSSSRPPRAARRASSSPARTTPRPS